MTSLKAADQQKFNIAKSHKQTYQLKEHQNLSKLY